jgi:chromosomal replication initiation ATPase DnaA
VTPQEVAEALRNTYGDNAITAALEAVRLISDARAAVPYTRVPKRAQSIVDAVCKHFGVERHELVGRSRLRRLAVPRRVCWALMRQRLEMSFEEIGWLFERDHTTVYQLINDGRDAAVIGALNETLDALEYAEAAE